MYFCKKCSSMMIPQKRGKSIKLICRSCGATQQSKKRSFKVSEKIMEKGAVKVVEQEVASLPKIKIHCEKCGCQEAYWWMQQTRSGDEAPTLFYKCCKCGYAWREYG